jgi:hypothetical protein
MSHDRQPPKNTRKHTLPGLNPLAQGQFPLETAKYAAFSQPGHFPLLGAESHVPRLFCVVRGRITRFSRFRADPALPTTTAKRGLFGSLPGTLLQMQASYLITVVAAKTRFIRVVKLIPKVAGKDSKNKGLSATG